MKCKNKVVQVDGIRSGFEKEFFKNVKFNVMITNDDHGKTISLDDGIHQFTIPFEPIEEYLK